MVVGELLDSLHVLHEHFFRRRRDEPLEFPCVADRVDEIEAAGEDREEPEERLPHDVVADGAVDRLKPVRAPRRDQILGQGQDRSEDPQGQNQGAELVPELAEKAHGGRRNEGSRDKLCREEAFNPAARCGAPWRAARHSTNGIGRRGHGSSSSPPGRCRSSTRASWRSTSRFASPSACSTSVTWVRSSSRAASPTHSWTSSARTTSRRRRAARGTRTCCGTTARSSTTW